MKYLIKSDSYTLVYKVLEELIKKHKITRESVYYIDYESNDSLNKTISEYLSSSLFEESKLIFLNNIDFFSKKEKPKWDILKKILELFKNKTDNIIVFHSQKLNKKNLFFEEWKDEIKLIEMESPKGKQLEDFVLDFFKKNNSSYKNNVVKKIIEMTEGDFDHLISEINKLILLEEEIDIKLLEKVLLDKKGESIFSLVDAVFLRDIKKIITMIDKLKVQDIGAFLILQMLIMDLTFMIAVKKLEATMTTQEILNLLKLNPYRFKKIIQKSNKYEIEEMNDFLDKLISLEKMIKSNSPTDQYKILKAKIISIN